MTVQTSDCLTTLSNRFGTRLERLAACEKLHLLSVLAFWQAVDTELVETTDNETYSLQEAIEDYAADIPGDTLEALQTLEGLGDQACLDLMVALSNQLRDGVYFPEAE